MDFKTETTYLLFAPEKEGVDDLIKEIRHNRVGQVQQTRSLEETRILVSSGKYQCLLLNLKYFRHQDAEMVDMLCSLHKSLAIVATARIVDEDAYKMIKDARNIILLQRPLREAKVIALFAKKFSTGKDSFKREHWRYPTNQPAIVEVLSNHKVFGGVMTNISRGGALFESDQEIDVMDRELVTLKIQLNDLNKNHALRAEVAWTSGFDKETKKASLGLKFIDPTEFNESVYSKLKT